MSIFTIHKDINANYTEMSHSKQQNLAISTSTLLQHLRFAYVYQSSKKHNLLKVNIFAFNPKIVC